MSMLDSDQPMPVVMRNRCVNCSLLIPRNHPHHFLQQASTTMIAILRSWITPTELSSESVLCTECMVILQDRASTFIDGNTVPLPAFGHRSLCFSCGKSILRSTRTHAVRSDRQERNIILRKVPLHLVSRLERVCNACWLAAYREVGHQNQDDTNRPILSEVGTSGEFNIPAPSPLQHTSQHSRQPSPATAKITSAVYRRAANTASHCMFYYCFESERLVIPAAIKELLLLNHKFYIPPGEPSNSNCLCGLGSSRRMQELASDSNLAAPNVQMVSKPESPPLPLDQNRPPGKKDSKNVNTHSKLAACRKLAIREAKGRDQPNSNHPPLSGAADDAGLSGDVNIPEPPLPPELNLHTAQMCRVCLALDVKMFDLRDAELKTMFQFSTGITIEENEGSKLGRLICWECAARLKVASKFRSKALFSDSLLQGLINEGEQIQKLYFEAIKAEADSLIPPKTLTVTEIVHIVEIKDKNKMTQLVRSGALSKNVETEIKDEIKDENSEMDVERDDNVAIKTEIEDDPTFSDTEEQSGIKIQKNSLTSSKTLTVSEIVQIVDIEDQNNTTQLVQSGVNDEPALSENVETEVKDEITDKNSEMDVEGDDNVAFKTEIVDDPTEEQSRTKIIEEYPLDSTSFVEKTINSGYSRSLLETGHTLLQSDSTSSQEDYEDQISKTLIEKSITDSKIVLKQKIELKSFIKILKVGRSHDHTYHSKRGSKDGNKTKEILKIGQLVKKFQVKKWQESHKSSVAVDSPQQMKRKILLPRI